MRDATSLGIKAILLAAVVGLIVGVAPAGATVFQNTTPIAVPVADGQRPASPYPSTITVSGLGSHIIDVNASLVGLSHARAQDIDVLLVGPEGQTVLLMSNVLYRHPSEGDCGPMGSNAVSGVNLTFDDGAPSLPISPPLASGSYSPTDYDACFDNFGNDTFPGGAPPGPYAAAMSAFNGTNPNGTWSLYVADDLLVSGTTGQIAGGWSIDITAADPCTPPGLPGAIVGTAGMDTINGTAGDDVILGLAGGDVINGLGGNDLICGGIGGDRISGGSGDDEVFGEDGLDAIQGDAGNDTLDGGLGGDRLQGGDDNDALFGKESGDQLFGENGTDTCDGGAGSDIAGTCETLIGVP